MSYITRFFYTILFIGFYTKEMLISNIQVGWDIVTPSDHFKPEILDIEIPLDNDVQIMLLMNLITFTPGTISINYDKNNQHLRVHVMYKDDLPDIKDKLFKTYVPFIKKVWP